MIAKRETRHGETSIRSRVLSWKRCDTHSNLVKMSFKGPAKMESSSYPEQATTAKRPVDHIRVNAAKSYPIMHKCCWALIGWSLVKTKDFKQQ